MNNESVTLKKILNDLIYVCWVHQETNKNGREKALNLMQTSTATMENSVEIP